LSENNISQAIYSEEFAEALSGYCKKNGVSVTAHLAFDTGMGRIGFADVDAAIRSCKLEGIKIEGAFTHFSRADMTDDESVEFTKNQYKKFEKIVSKLKNEIKTPLVCHSANSAGAFKYPEFQMDMVRAGIVLYGLAPNPDDSQSYSDIKPAMQLKTVISHIKEVEAGAAISYGGTFVADKKMRIATVPCGYADGYLRSFGAGYVLVCGKRAKIVGRVCMDQMMIDVTDIPEAKLLGTVTLMGKSGDEYISADDLAKLDESINYQVVCGVTKRVIRVYE
jgi:alanine racemase